MHIPDGFIDAPVSAGAAALAVGGVALSLRRAGDVELEARAPMTGLVAAFVFAGQMLNFPVAAGTSGHLIGGVLAAVLVGPWLGALALTVVLVVQSLLFADGGLSALGLNVVNMALVPAFAGYALFRGVRALLPARASSVTAATAVAAYASVVLASVAFTVEYALGGVGGVATSTLLASMVGVHLLIGAGEAAISGLVVGAVMASRPDLVAGAADIPRTVGGLAAT